MKAHFVVKLMADFDDVRFPESMEPEEWRDVIRAAETNCQFVMSLGDKHRDLGREGNEAVLKARAEALNVRATLNKLKKVTRQGVMRWGPQLRAQYAEMVKAVGRAANTGKVLQMPSTVAHDAEVDLSCETIIQDFVSGRSVKDIASEWELDCCVIEEVLRCVLRTFCHIPHSISEVQG